MSKFQVCDKVILARYRWADDIGKVLVIGEINANDEVIPSGSPGWRVKQEDLIPWTPEDENRLKAPDLQDAIARAWCLERGEPYPPQPCSPSFQVHLPILLSRMGDKWLVDSPLLLQPALLVDDVPADEPPWALWRERKGSLKDLHPLLQRRVRSAATTLLVRSFFYFATKVLAYDPRMLDEWPDPEAEDRFPKKIDAEGFRLRTEWDFLRYLMEDGVNAAPIQETDKGVRLLNVELEYGDLLKALVTEASSSRRLSPEPAVVPNTSVSPRQPERST